MIRDFMVPVIFDGIITSAEKPQRYIAANGSSLWWLVQVENVVTQKMMQFNHRKEISAILTDGDLLVFIHLLLSDRHSSLFSSKVGIQCLSNKHT